MLNWREREEEQIKGGDYGRKMGMRRTDGFQKPAVLIRHAFRQLTGQNAKRTVAEM
jgi:hypothetical protein